VRDAALLLYRLHWQDMLLLDEGEGGVTTEPQVGAAGVGVLVLVLGCWCWCWGAGAGVLVLGCWCWGAGAGVLALGCWRWRWCSRLHAAGGLGTSRQGWQGALPADGSTLLHEPLS
jgi:hypothetical protein